MFILAAELKPFAAILALLTLYLSAQQPVLSARIPAPSEKECAADRECRISSPSCKKEKPAPAEKEEPGKCCELFFCNPFGACCTYLPAERELISAASFLLENQRLVPADENSLSSFSKEIWQPPEFASPL